MSVTDPSEGTTEPGLVPGAPGPTGDQGIAPSGGADAPSGARSGRDPQGTADSADLTGRVALVTGAGSGLGRAIATVLAESGVHVVVGDVNTEGAQRSVDAITAADPSGRAEAVTLDVADPASVDAVVEDLAGRYGDRFDLLVNNAGTDRGSDLVDIDDAAWHSVFGVNVHGPMHVSRAFVRHRLKLDQRSEAGASGARIADVVNVVSISALTVGAGAGAYNSSKAALLKLTEVMQTEAREHGWPVRVTAINPAAMATPMMDQWGLPPERMMDPRQVASLIRFAVSLPPESVLQSAVITLRNETYPR